MAESSFLNQSQIATVTILQNFVPQLSLNLAVTQTSSGATFGTLTGTTRPTFKITNVGTSGAYIGWGKGTATATFTTTGGAGVANCDFIGPGMCMVESFQTSGGVVDTLAACTSGSPNTTSLEISIGFGA